MKKIMPIIFLLLFFGCKDNGYESPIPGIIEIRLKINRGSFINDGYLNLIVQSLKITTPNGSYSDIYDNENAIRDNTDSYNVFDRQEIIIGRMYLPPQEYSELLLSISPADSMIYNNNLFIVIKPSSFDALNKINVNTTINSEILTTITIQCCLDSILNKKIDHYEYQHNYLIESIANQRIAIN